MDVNEFFTGIFKNNLQGALIVPLHAVARDNNKEIRNKGLHIY